MYLYRYEALSYFILRPISNNTITWWYTTDDEHYMYLYRFDAISYLMLSPIQNTKIKW